MVVNGVAITPEQIEAGKARMTQGPFTYLEIQRALMNAGVPEADSVAYRAADRLMQLQRKAGLIEFRAKVWSPCAS